MAGHKRRYLLVVSAFELHQLCEHCPQWLTIRVYKWHQIHFYHILRHNTWQQAEEASSESDTDQNSKPLDAQQPINKHYELQGMSLVVNTLEVP